MKCKVCHAESGKYPLCRACYRKTETGEIVKCQKCNNWHLANKPCQSVVTRTTSAEYLYNAKKTLISKSEQAFYSAIVSCLPSGYHVFPQVNLATFINRTDDARYHNELFRNVDFLVVDNDYRPKFVIEINDQSHLMNERKERDEKVQKICEEAGVPILKLWTSYGVNAEYIKKRIDEILSSLPIARVHHFSQELALQKPATTTHLTQSSVAERRGCYVATCVYGSYDCPEVWVLRRFRDKKLSKCFGGKIFIKVYYMLSPFIVKWFGDCGWFVATCKLVLDKMVNRLKTKGFAATPYDDSISL